MVTTAALCSAIAIAYFGAGTLGLSLAFVNPSATVVWPPSGIALAALMILGRRVSPGVFAGAFAVNAATIGTSWPAIAIAMGNTLEALAAAALAGRFAGGREAFTTRRNVVAFALLAGVLSPMVAATIGVTTLIASGLAPWGEYYQTWVTWWLGDAAGILVLSPALLLWHAEPRPRWLLAEKIEAGVLLAALVTCAAAAFVWSPYPVAFVCVPLCVWSAMRFGPREAASAACILSLVAVWGSAQGRGSFSGHSPNESLVLLATFMAVVSMVSLVVATSVLEKRRVEAALKASNADMEARVRARTAELASALERVRVSESRFIEAQQVANVGSWEQNVADRTEIWSSQMFRILGLTPHSVPPSFENFARFLHKDDRGLVDGVISRAMADRRPFECEHRIIRADGAVRTLHVLGRVAVDAHGNVSRLIGTTQDVTEYKAAQEVTARSERRLRTIIDAEPACVTLVSSQGVVLDINPAGVQLIGAESLADIAGGHVVDLIHPDDRERLVQCHRAATGGATVRTEFRIKRLDGQERSVESHFVPFDMPDADDTGRTVLGVTSDVTERKRLEERLRQSQKLEATGLLAGGIAHDFNNLLTAMGGFAELTIATLDVGDPRRDNLQEVVTAVHRAAALTQQLLAVSRRQVLKPTILDVNELVTGVQKLLRHTIPENIAIELDLPVGLERVRADRGQIEQVLLNLAINAGDAMLGGGCLRISTSLEDVDASAARERSPMPPGRYVRLMITDTGTGMAPEVQAHIFEPFFTTKEPGKGTGLGLATVYGIVKQSGGFIWVKTEPGCGTAFEIYLPAVQAQLERAVAVPSSRVPRKATQTILIAEDDGAVRRLTRDILAGHGYAVFDAANGEEALVVADQRPGPIDLLITDVVMPGLSGCELASRLVRSRPALRVLYMSGYTDRIMNGTGFEDALPLIRKPFLPTDLLIKVGETLAHPDGRHKLNG